MRPNNLITGGLLLIVLLFVGCASYSSSSVRMDTFTPHNVKNKGGDLSIHMEEHASQDKREPEVAASTAKQGEIPLYQLLL